MVDGEGNIFIPKDEFYNFIKKFAPHADGADFFFGPPMVIDGDVRIAYAFSTECHPYEWAEPPPAVVQWTAFEKAMKELEENEKKE